MELELMLTQPINDTPVDGYYGEKEAWFSRYQIGAALGYNDPQNAITYIHKRHKERLDKFSRWCQFVTPSGVQEGYVYNTKGVLEICRWSRQPKADEVMEKLYDMAEQVMKKGYFSVLSDEALAALLDEQIKRTVDGKKKLRESREQASVLLDLERNRIDHDEYVMRLRAIWKEDSYGFHRCFDDYMKWYNNKKSVAI